MTKVVQLDGGSCRLWLKIHKLASSLIMLMPGPGYSYAIDRVMLTPGPRPGCSYATASTNDTTITQWQYNNVVLVYRAVSALRRWNVFVSLRMQPWLNICGDYQILAVWHEQGIGLRPDPLLGAPCRAHFAINYWNIDNWHDLNHETVETSREQNWNNNETRAARARWAQCPFATRVQSTSAYLARQVTNRANANLLAFVHSLPRESISLIDVKRFKVFCKYATHRWNTCTTTWQNHL